MPPHRPTFHTAPKPTHLPDFSESIRDPSNLIPFRPRLKIHQAFSLADRPPDDTLLQGLDPLQLIKDMALPWRKIGRAIIFVAADPDNFTPPTDLPFGVTRTHVIPAPAHEITTAISQHFGEELVSHARTLCPTDFSCRNLKINFKKPMVFFGFTALIASVLLFPFQWLITALLWITITNASASVLRISAMLVFWKHTPVPAYLPESSPNISLLAPRPKVTILVPLFKEEKTLPSLIASLERLQYPPDQLEILLLLEDADTQTPNALQCIDLPKNINILNIPEDWLKTKPKAMNYALPFCTGDIIGIYDAEDRPEPGQISKVVNHFLAAPANVACVQGQLDYFNSRENWIARCFTIEYAMWFRVVMKGVQNLSIPIPLGGTTLFFRRHMLEEIGGWDAHNVTEDADLGMRLARFGYRCEIVNSTTWEEASTRPMQWIRQRSRWLKGFAMTWASHMRNPVKLYTNLGFVGFAGFQVLLLSGLTSFLAAPLYLALGLSFFDIPIVPIQAIPTWVWVLFTVTMVGAEITLWIAAITATWDKSRRHLMLYILALPFYWPLGAVAAYKAMFEVIFAPFYWDKTNHGPSKDS